MVTKLRVIKRKRTTLINSDENDDAESLDSDVEEEKI